MNGRHDHSTAVCVSLRWSEGLRENHQENNTKQNPKKTGRADTACRGDLARLSFVCVCVCVCVLSEVHVMHDRRVGRFGKGRIGTSCKQVWSGGRHAVLQVDGYRHVVEGFKCWPRYTSSPLKRCGFRSLSCEV